MADILVGSDHHAAENHADSFLFHVLPMFFELPQKTVIDAELCDQAVCYVEDKRISGQNEHGIHYKHQD